MNWWKILCLDCGSDTELLKDIYHRVICRECLDKNEFTEVENELSENEETIHSSCQQIRYALEYLEAATGKTKYVHADNRREDLENDDDESE